MRWPMLAAVGAAIAVTGSCSTSSLEATEERTAVQSPAIPAPAASSVATQGAAAAMDAPPERLELSYRGELEQGGWIRGTVPSRTVSLQLDGADLEISQSGQYFAAFDRDAASTATLVATLADGTNVTERMSIAPRRWNIQHVNVAKRSGGSSEAWWKKREPEWNAIRDARAQQTGAAGWQQDFVWPVKGRISGLFGRQRVYRGEPGSYHSGIDIAPGNGVRFVAPADGVVVLARTGFSLEGGLIIIDHGAGLNSAFLHASKIAVSEGQRVAQGDYIGNVGATGRATGPHLHWSLKWRDARVDPLLFTGPMN